MLKILRNICLSACVMSAVAGLNSELSINQAKAGTVIEAWGDIAKTGNAGGTIRVTSGDGQSWTSITPSQFSFPVAFTAHAMKIFPLSRVWVVQGDPLDVTHHDLYDTNDAGTGLQGPTFHSDTKTLFGGTLNLSNNERNEIIAACNAKLKPFANEQPEHQTETQIPVTLVMQTTTDGVSWSDGAWAEGIYYGEAWESVNFTLPVICEGFTRDKPSVPGGVATPDQDSSITKVELALSKDGAATTDTLTYTGSCPTGLTLNMGWFTTLSATLKSYVQHKSAVGSHDWNSPEFSVTTNQPAAGGEWKKEMTDFMSIPFAGQTPVGGGQVGHNVPSNGLMVGGNGGSGGIPQNNLETTNTGAGDGSKRYVGFFRVVAYKSKKTVPVLQVGGGWTNTVVYSGKKFSPWRKYDFTCEPQQSTVALDSPDGIQNAPNTGTFNPDDEPAFPRPKPVVDTTFDPATRDLTIPPTHAPKPKGNIVRTNPKTEKDNVPARIKALAAEARRKQAAKKKQGQVKRVNNAAIKAQKMKLKADAAKRAAQERARKSAAKRRAAIAADLARKRLAAQLLARKRAAAAAQASQPATRAFNRRKGAAKSFSRSRTLRVR